MLFLCPFSSPIHRESYLHHNQTSTVLTNISLKRNVASKTQGSIYLQTLGKLFFFFFFLSHIVVEKHKAYQGSARDAWLCMMLPVRVIGHI